MQESIANVGLGTLALHGGTTQTRNIDSPTSVLLNSGTNTGVPATDANGNARIFGGTVDIGSTEFQSVLTVDTLSDDPNAGFTLREAIAAAQANGVGLDAIVFAANLAGNLTLTSGQLQISNSNLSINGDTNGDGNPDIILDGNFLYSHFLVDAGANLSLQSLALTRGYNYSYSSGDAFGGGSITNNGTLSIAYCDFTYNSANADDSPGGDGFSTAGAIFNRGTLNITQSTLTGGNALGGRGGDGNLAGGGDGGAAASGIVNTGFLSISHTVIASGRATGGNGGKGANGATGSSYNDGYDGYGGGNGGAAVHGILNLGSMMVGSGVQNRTPLSITGGQGGIGGNGGHPGPSGIFDGNPGNSGNVGDAFTGNAGSLINLAAETNNGTSGADTLTLTSSSFFGLGGNDIITDQNSTINTIHGGAGNDTVIMVNSSLGDVFNGGLGTNTLVQNYAGFGGNIVINMITGFVNNTNNNGNYAAFSNFQNVTVNSEMGIIGNAQNNILIGSSTNLALSNNNFDGGAGDDTLRGGLGADVLTGGDNTSVGDTVDYSTSAAGVTVSLSGQTASGAGSDAEGDSISGFENVVGSNHVDYLRGDTGRNSLFGGLGADVLVVDVNDANLAGEIFDGGGDSDTMQITGSGNFTVNLRDDTITSIENLQLLDAGANNTRTLLLNANQFGGTSIAANALVAHDAFSDTNEVFDILMDTSTTLTLAGLTFNSLTNLNTMSFVITGDNDAETITGSSIRDVINSGGGGDMLNGGAGNDTINGGSGFDTINGGAGDDIIIHSGGDFGGNVDGGADIDVLDLSGWTTSSIAFSVNLLSQNYQFVPNAFGASGTYVLLNVENVIGSNFNDFITGDGLANVLEGGLGNDVIDGGLGSDTLSLAGSTVGMSVYLGGFGAAGNGYSWDGIAQDNLTSIENVSGSAHADFIVGDSANNQLNGNGGSDTIEGGLGNDAIDGGLGSDTLSLAGSTVGMSVYLGGFGSAGNGYSWDGIAQDNLTSIENVAGSAHADYIVGDSANNQLNGNGGSDTIEGGLGNDVIDGGLGSDTLSLAGSTVGMSVYLGGFGAAGNGYSWDGIAQDNLTSIENVAGSAHADFIVGDSANNQLNGNGGSDTIEGGLGNDVIDGGLGSDTLSLAGSTVGMSVYLGGFGAAGNGYSWDGIAQDNLTSIENVAGSAHADFIVGDSANNQLNGNGGSDTIEGGLGNDVIDGGLGSDTLSLAGSTVGMSVYLGGFGAAGNGYSWDGIAQDSLTSIENVSGSAHADYLVGDSVANVLTGGLGSDTFVFNAALFGTDTITDFQNGIDHISLAGSGLSFASFSVSQSGPDTILSLIANPTQTITFLNIASANITGDDFF